MTKNYMNENLVSAENKHNEVWKASLSIIRDIVDESVFKVWFAPIVPLSLENSTLTVRLPSTYFAEFLDETYGQLMFRVLHRTIGPNASLRYSIKVANTAGSPMIEQDSDNKQQKVGAQHTSSTFNPFFQSHQKIDSQLNPNYTMESFVEGSCNKLARQAGQVIARDPGGKSHPFNPIFIYGGSGLGKTHLAHAIGLEIEKKHPELNVLYVSANKFQIQYMDASRSNRLTDFLNFYQMMDVLIIDDIQDIAGKTGTQNTFFHIFNHLHQSGKQVILTSDQSTKVMQGLDQRILSRFKWGLHAELEAPDFETKKKILLNKVKKDGLLIPEDVVEYVAESVNSNVRELEGVISSLLAQATLVSAEINIELAQKVVGRIVNTTEKVITIPAIQEVVCKYFHLDVNDIQTKSRKREVVQARQIAMYLARKHTKCSLTAIGEQIGNRDHATVLHACKTVTDQLDIDKGLKLTLTSIEKSLK